jgi:hypothetical protein
MEHSFLHDGHGSGSTRSSFGVPGTLVFQVCVLHLVICFWPYYSEDVSEILQIVIFDNTLSSPRRLTAWQDEQNASCPLQQIPNSDVESGRALQRRQRNKSASLMYMYLCNLSCSNKNVITWISPEYSASQVTMSCRNVTSGLLHMTVRRTLRFTLLAFSSLNDLSFFFFFSFVWQYMIYVNTVSLMSSNSSVASYRSRALFQTFDNLSIYLTETHMSCHCPCHNGSPWPPTSLHEV